MGQPLETPLPDWLSIRPVEPPTPKEQYQIERRARVADWYERLLVAMANGYPSAAALREIAPDHEHGVVIGYAMRDPERKRRYYEAMEVSAEIRFGKTFDYADGTDPLAPGATIERQRFQFEHAKWSLEVMARKRFGQKKEIEQNITIDLRGAMADARARAGITSVIEGEAERIESDDAE